MVEGVLSPIFQNMVEPVVPSLAGDLTPSCDPKMVRDDQSDCAHMQCWRECVCVCVARVTSEKTQGTGRDARKKKHERHVPKQSKMMLIHCTVPRRCNRQRVLEGLGLVGSMRYQVVTSVDCDLILSATTVIGCGLCEQTDTRQTITELSHQIMITSDERARARTLPRRPRTNPLPYLRQAPSDNRQQKAVVVNV